MADERVGIEAYVDPRKAEIGARKAGKAFDHVGDKADKAEKKSALLSKTVGKLGAALGAYASIGVAVNTLKRADAVAVLDQRIRSATEATGDYAEVSKELLAISQRNGVELASTVDLYQRLSFSAEALGATSTDILTLSDAVQQLGVIGGTTKQQMDNALLQFSQMLGQSKPQAEELNSILDSMPLLAKKIEKGLNLLPGSLKTAVREGRVLTQDIFATLVDQAPEIAAQFEDMPLSIARASTMLGNSWDQYIHRADDATSATNLVASAIKKLAEILDGPKVENLVEAKRLKMVEQLRREYEELGRLIASANNEELKAGYINARERTLLQYNALMDSYIEKQKEAQKEEAKAAPASAPTVETGLAATDNTSAVSAIDRHVAALEVQSEVLGMTSRQAELYRLKMRGATDEQLVSADAALATTEAYKSQAAAAELLQEKTIAGEAALESVRQHLLSEQEALEEHYAARRQIVLDNTAAEGEGRAAILLELEEKFIKQRDQMAAASTSAQLQNSAALFGDLADIAGEFAGEQSGIYKAMFAVSKAFAIADSIIKIQQGIASAASLAFPANIAAMATVASQTAGIVSTIQSTNIAGARSMGGPVAGSRSYIVGERGPEVISTGPGGGHVTPNDKAGGDITVNIVEDASRAGTVERDQREVTVFVSAAMAQLESDINSGRGVAPAISRMTGTSRRAR